MILVTGGLGMIGAHTAHTARTTRLAHDTGFAPTFDIAAAVADYVAWRAGNPR
jgi:nucleoside-diphosphate-sugar epimerase